MDVGATYCNFEPGSKNLANAAWTDFDGNNVRSIDMLTSTGDLRNPVDPGSRILFYRNNRTGRSPDQQVHNEKNFDLWGAGSDGVFDRVNNWNSVVSAP